MAKARTAAQRAALRKAQLASARKRKGRKRRIKASTRKNLKAAGSIIGRFATVGAAYGATRGAVRGGYSVHSNPGAYGLHKSNMKYYEFRRHAMGLTAAGAAGGALGGGLRGGVRWGAIGAGVVGGAMAVGAVRKRRKKSSKTKRR